MNSKIKAETASPGGCTTLAKSGGLDRPPARLWSARRLTAPRTPRLPAKRATRKRARAADASKRNTPASHA